MNPKVKVAVAAFTLLMVVGTVGYTLIEEWSVLDSLYMTVITLSTVGFGELRPLSDLGKLFTSILILAGVGILFYTLTKITEALVEKRLFHRRRVQMEIKRTSQHVIVCGYGRMGETVCSQLVERGLPLVVIEKNSERCETLDGSGILHICGDATDDSTLMEAGVQRAKALATVLPHDAENLFITLTARTLNNQLTIVTRASNQKNEPKMLAAGADRVLNPYSNGGRQMVRQLLHPSVTEFIDVISARGKTELSLEEVELQEGSSLVGVSLRDAPIRAEMDVIVVGIRRSTQGLIFNPPSDMAPQAGDVLVALGRLENLRQLEQLATSKK
jgi:voltage-gated potassium channel